MKKLFPNEMAVEAGHGCVLALRARMAWELVSRFALISAQPDGEDTAGRQKLNLLPPTDVVSRCFAITDEFMDVVERREEIKPLTLTLEQRHAERGRLSNIEHKGTWAALKEDKKEATK